MDDILLWIVGVPIGIGIIWWMFSSFIDKIKEPYEAKTRLIDIEAKEKEKMSWR